MFAVCLFAGLSAAHAQQPAAAAPVTAAAAPLIGPPAAPDPKLLKQMEATLNHKFTRDPNDIFNALERKGLPDTQNFSDRFLSNFRAGDWPKIREDLGAMPLELARRVYDKMLADLTERPKPNMRLDDVLALGDAVPLEFTWDQVHRLGQLLGLAVPANESYWIADRIAKGSERLGGNEPAKRLLAGRVLLAGGFKDLARAWLPPFEQLETIADENVRNELSAFLSSQRESEAAQRGQVQKIWDENIRILTLEKVNDWERTKAAQAMSRVITQIPAGTLAPVFAEMLKNSPDGAARLVGGLGRKLQNEARGEIPLRTENLKAQAVVASLLAESADLAAQPWNQLSQIMAEFWSTEADYTFAQKTAANPNDRQKFVSPEDLLASAPAGKWAESLPPSVRGRIDVSLSRVILAGANFEAAADRIVEIGKRTPAAGVALAEDFLGVWAKTNNPQIPEPLRRKYELSEDARIPVTPLMMEKNIESLAKMMALFRAAGIAPTDYEKVVGAFDLAYSSAEAYRPGHIEKVFGPIEKMDEPLFFLILSRMNANLTERWRKMDVQKAGLTRRDETQTLEMVRAGYGSALGMIENWLAGHPEGFRALTLAGTLLTDWGDFEFFQELVGGDPRKRMVGYKEKNLAAQEYFERGAAAYAKQVPGLGAADYSIDAYLGWFNGLLGIGSGGQLNLSKAMNRAALNKIREQLVALPGKAAAAHISQFAKVVNARLADEKEPLHENLKYRYLASALLITKDDPFTLGAEKKVAYFDELLSEIRLQTRVDGPNTVGRDQDFGIIVSIIHTEAMGRVAQFGQYLSNDPNAGPGGKARRKVSPLAKKMREAAGARDELELGISETLSPFFEIKSITFAAPEVKPRPTAQPGWEETVLAYLLVRAKDASVDKIPPVAMELKFMDLSGPVTIPAESAETVIKVGGSEARPARALEITQTLDNRQFDINGGLVLEVKATAGGLVPELEELVDLAALKKAVPVKNINPHEGLQIKELNTWGDQVGPRSERLWSIALDGDPIRAAEAPIKFEFPALKTKDAAAVYQTYSEMNLVALQEPSVLIGRAETLGRPVANSTENRTLWTAAATLAILAGGALLVSRKRRALLAAQPEGARAAFKMPGRIDGFSVAALLRRLRTSQLVSLHAPQKAELAQDLSRIESACFGAGSTMSEADLRGVAEKWLRAVG